MKKKLQNFIFLLLQLSSGAVCGVFGALYLISFLDLSSDEALIYMMVSFFVFYLAATYLHVIIHETGHLIFGCLTGYEFSSIRFGCFMFLKEDGRIKLKLYQLTGTAGQCLLIPPEYNNGNYPYFLYNMGGCIMNIIASLISLILFLVLNNPWINTFLVIFSINGIAFALSNGIPLQTSQISNDGANTLAIYRSTVSKKAFWLQMKISELSSKNIRLKDMDENLFELDDHLQTQDSLSLAIEIFKTQRALDSKNFVSAKALTQELLKHSDALMGLHLHLLLNDMIFYHLLEKNLEQANQVLNLKEHKKMRKAMQNSPSFLRTNYAYQLLLGEHKKAEKIYKTFSKVAKNYPYVCDIESEKELMEYFKESLV